MASKLPSTLGERLVPRATRRVASLDPSAGLNLTRRGSAAIGAGYGDLAQGLEVAEKAAYENHLRDEERNLKNLENEWGATRRKILFGDGTPNNQGFFATSGEDTLNARAGLEQQLNKARSLILGKAQGRVKQAFDLSSQASLQGDLEQADRYTIGQRKEANLRTSQASIKEVMQQASTYFSDDKKWDAAVDRIGFEMASMGDEQGWSQETINSETQKAISKAARQRIDRALITDAKSGELIYSKTKDMIDGDQRIEIEQDIKAAKNAERIQQEHEIAMAKLAKQEASDNAQLEYVNKFLMNEFVSLKEIGQDNRMNATDKLVLQRLFEADANSDKISTGTSQRNTAEIFRRMNLPVGDPQRINDLMEINMAFANQKVNRTDFNFLVNRFSENKTVDGERLNKKESDFLNMMKGSISKSTLLGPDPSGDRRFYEYSQMVDQKIRDARKNNEDPYALLNPADPKYLGKPEILQTYKGSFDDRINDMQRELTGDSNTIPASPTTPAKQYKSKEEVVDDYMHDKLTYDEAAKILIDNGWATPDK